MPPLQKSSVYASLYVCNSLYMHLISYLYFFFLLSAFSTHQVSRSQFGFDMVLRLRRDYADAWTRISHKPVGPSARASADSSGGSGGSAITSNPAVENMDTSLQQQQQQQQAVVDDTIGGAAGIDEGSGSGSGSDIIRTLPHTQSHTQSQLQQARPPIPPHSSSTITTSHPTMGNTHKGVGANGCHSTRSVRSVSGVVKQQDRGGVSRHEMGGDALMRALSPLVITLEDDDTNSAAADDGNGSGMVPSHMARKKTSNGVHRHNDTLDHFLTQEPLQSQLTALRAEAGSEEASLTREEKRTRFKEFVKTAATGMGLGVRSKTGRGGGDGGGDGSNGDTSKNNLLPQIPLLQIPTQPAITTGPSNAEPVVETTTTLSVLCPTRLLDQGPPLAILPAR